MRHAGIESCGECPGAATGEVNTLSESMRKRLARVLVCLGYGVLLVLPIGYLTFLGWHEGRFRESVVAALPGVVSAAARPSVLPLNTTAIATVLGLTPESSPLPSAEHRCKRR